MNIYEVICNYGVSCGKTAIYSVLIKAKDRKDAIRIAKENKGGFNWWDGPFVILTCKTVKNELLASPRFLYFLEEKVKGVEKWKKAKASSKKKSLKKPLKNGTNKPKKSPQPKN